MLTVSAVPSVEEEGTSATLILPGKRAAMRSVYRQNALTNAVNLGLHLKFD